MIRPTLRLPLVGDRPPALVRLIFYTMPAEVVHFQ